MVDVRAGCSSCSMTNSFVTVTNAVLIERALSCWHLHKLLWQTTQYRFTLKWTKNEIVGSRGWAREPVPHSWRRHWPHTPKWGRWRGAHLPLIGLWTRYITTSVMYGRFIARSIIRASPVLWQIPRYIAWKWLVTETCRSTVRWMSFTCRKIAVALCLLFLQSSHERDVVH